GTCRSARRQQRARAAFCDLALGPAELGGDTWTLLNSASNIANGSAPDKPIHRNPTARIFAPPPPPIPTHKTQSAQEHERGECYLPVQFNPRTASSASSNSVLLLASPSV